MAQAIIGKVPYFDHTQNNWAIFHTQLDQFFIANEIVNEPKKKAILLTSLCKTSHMLLQNLVSPAKVEDVVTTFDMCLAVMNKHFKTATSGFAERFKFYNATKSSTETINEWAVRVRSLAVHCEFGANLETAIRDKFVMGLEKGPARDKIFLESVESSFEKVVEIANNVEYAKHQYDVIEDIKEENLHFIKINKTKQQKEQYQVKTATQQQCKVDVLLKSYNGMDITPLGSCNVEVKYGNKTKVIPIIVIKNGGPPLLGRNFLKNFEIKICNLNYSVPMANAQQIIGEFKNLFDGSFGLFKGGQAVLKIKDQTIPKFFRPRPLPLAIKDKVEKEIDNLVRMNILQPVGYCEWGTPIVPIVKKNGGIRICGDFKVTLNPYLNVEKYPLPRIEDIFSKLHGGEEFTKLDLSMAYQQIQLDEQSRKYTTISTSKGLFQYTRLIYGLASAPTIFQRIMDSVLAGLDGVVVFLDDILISAPNRKLHVERLKRVLNILNAAGFKLASEKYTKFVWNDSCSTAVDHLKSLLLADNCLAHFNVNYNTRLTVDASPVGVGAVLSQIDEQGVERPIEFASRSLTDTEKRYSQLDREAVAILFGVKKCRRDWQHNRSLAAKQRLSIASKKLKRALQSEEDRRNRNYIESLTSTKHTNFSLWKASMNIKRLVEGQSPIRKSDGSWARSAKDKTVVFAEHLSNVFQPNPPSNNFVLGDLPVRIGTDSELINVSIEDVQTIIKDNLKLRKSAGYDLITPSMNAYCLLELTKY
ncbi:uncharacterized protein LOC135950789 [Calliphora vicina]|uniref:uncharacterized protein LOC135950789 n=1 Tax=Calliphora vicina TaxID=7373 RepID=UPI00325AC16B